LYYQLKVLNLIIFVEKIVYLFKTSQIFIYILTVKTIMTSFITKNIRPSIRGRRKCMYIFSFFRLKTLLNLESETFYCTLDYEIMLIWNIEKQMQFNVIYKLNALPSAIRPYERDKDGHFIWNPKVFTSLKEGRVLCNYGKISLNGWTQIIVMVVTNV